MKTNIYIYGLLLPMLLSACSVSKDLETPRPELPDAFRNAATLKDTTSIADLPWKTFFTDTTLQKLIDNAIGRNYDMQAAVKNIEASRLLFKQVKWNYVPEIGANVTASTNRPSNNSLDGLSLASYKIGTSHIEDYSVDISISWEADIWGRIHNQNKAALAAYLQTIEAKKAVQTSLVAEVSQGYYNLLMLDDQLAIARRNVRLTDSTLHIVMLQYDAGQVTQLAVEQTRAQEQSAQQLIPGLEQNVAVQENALHILAGSLPGIVERNSNLDAIQMPANLSAGVPSALVGRRPDVRSAELNLEIANANVEINKAAMYPALRITAEEGVNSFKASNWFNIPSSLFGIVAASLAQPLLYRKELSTQYQVAQVNREKTAIQFRQTVLVAVGEVSDALVKIDKLGAQEAVAAKRVNALNHATANANLLFKNGMANYLEVITAQSNVLQSQLQLATIKRDELIAVSELYRSLGGGLN